MHSNIEVTIDRFLAEVVERDVVADLEPLRTRIVSVELRSMTAIPKIVVSVNPGLDDCEEERMRADDEIPG